jgi:hypothetical protein
MHDPGAMRRVERSGHLDAEGDGTVHCQGAALQ